MAALAAGEPGVTAEATKVVVVEDDPASADVLRRRLQANGMHVDVAGDGLGGLRLVQEVRPDLVLLDVMLPDTDGYDVCLRIKSDPETADIPVIFLSARGEVVDKVRGLSCGAADYVTKPFQAAERRVSRAPSSGAPPAGSSLAWRSRTRPCASTSWRSSPRGSTSRPTRAPTSCWSASGTRCRTTRRKASRHCGSPPALRAPTRRTSSPPTGTSRASPSSSPASSAWTTTSRPRPRRSSCSRPPSRRTTGRAPGTRSVWRRARCRWPACSGSTSPRA